ncbi:MAG: TonB-dependent receptor, partial [Pseudomonadota bacterium]
FEKLFIGSNAGTFSTPFEAATNDSFEVGLKYQTPDNRIGVTLSAYLNRVKNGQLFDFAFTGPTTLAYFFVNQDYDTRGVELEGHVELLPDLVLRGAVSALDTEFVNTPPGSSTGVQDGNEVPLAANLSAFLGIDYRLRGARVGLPGDVLMGADWSYVGERQVDAANRWQLPAYHLVNVRLGWAVGGGSVYIFANNLFDERPVYTGAEYAPDVHAVAIGPGRIVGIGGEFTF